MAHLSLSLLGPFQVMLGGRPVTGFKSNKVRALLAYLAVEADRLHRRETLAGLLWPDWPDRDALSNLRYALFDLRKVIRDRRRADDSDAEEPFLLVTRDTLRFNKASDHWLDVAAFTQMVEADQADASVIDRLEQAVSLYRGGFLEGFSLGDSPAFEEWALFTREQIARQVSSALHRLAAAYETRGEYEQARSYAWRQLELEPWDEVAHRQLMRSLTLSGQRGAALVQYETCRRLLSEELGVEPGEETARLYDRIRDGSLSGGADEWKGRGAAPAGSVTLPRFLEEEPPQVETPVFVARERELGQLDQFLDQALGGRGQVVFVTGEAGSGKTALIQAFTARAQEMHGDLLVASGQCRAYAGVGDPYLPFREILQLLTGDVEARWAAGAINREHARRLWNTLPLAVQALLETGPDLIGTFVPGTALVERAAAATTPAVARTAEAASPDATHWLRRLEGLVQRKEGGSAGPGLQQSALFEQYTAVLQALARRRPLVLVLDDLQWADVGSVNLLFHLGRQVGGGRILMVGAYRPEEVALGRDGERHPLEPVINELRRDFGDITVALDRAAGQDFVEALLDTEPNRLGAAFRETLYRQTRGHPLFTIELLRGLQERGDLVQDREGRWVDGPGPDWETLPARVEAVIGERIARLDQPLRTALRVGSVEGETFTAEVVARVRGTSEREMLRQLSGVLDRRHRLVQAESIQRIHEQILSRYRFRHILFQKYVYGSLDEVERVHLHEAVGNVLERLYGDRAREIAVQLARQFEEAGMTHKAIDYLHQAGQRALQLSAYQEAITHLTRGLSLLETLPKSLEATEQELALQMTLGMVWTHGPGTQAAEVGEAYARARELCQETGKTSQLCRVLGELSVHHYVRGDYWRAREMAEEALRLARRAQDPLLVALSHWYVGIILFPLGEYGRARTHLQQTISWYDPQEHHRSLVNLRGSDVGPCALAYEACCLWCLGYPERGLKQSQKALALGRELNHPFTLADVLAYAGCLFNSLRGDAQAARKNAEELIALSKEVGFHSWLVTGTFHLGEALAMTGRLEEGIAKMQNAMAEWQSLGVRCYSTGMVNPLARAEGELGQVKEAVATVSEALALMEETDERCYEPELHRLRGELLLQQGDEGEAEVGFDKAIEVARRQQAKSWELRATVSLCRLWQQQGKGEEARQRLAAIYGWFTEGFETPDLVEARTLLKALPS